MKTTSQQLPERNRFLLMKCCKYQGKTVCTPGHQLLTAIRHVKVQNWTNPEGSRRLRLPDFKTVVNEGAKVVSPTHRPPLPSRKYSWYSFLLAAESTPGT